MRINFQLFNNYKFNKKQDNKNIQTNSNIFAQNPFLRTPQKDIVQISFGDKHCSENKFALKNISNLRCPACGLIMLNDKEIQAFADDIANKKGKQLASTLELYEDDTIFTNKQNEIKKSIFRPVKQEVVDIIQELAIEYPDKNLLELVKIQAKRSIDDLIKKQMEVIYELDEYISNNIDDENELPIFRQAMKEYINQIEGKSEERFSRKRFIFGIKIKTNDSSKRDEIEKIASKMPTSENDANSFFVKYSTRAETPREVALKLVNLSIPTAEHIIPQSKGGADRLSNYLCDCADCNSKRGNLDFSEWAKTIPDFEQNLQNYIFEVQKEIDSDRFDRQYDDYNEKIISLIYSLTNGEIDLKLPDSKNPKKVKVIMEKRKREVSKIVNEFAKLEERKTRLEEEIAELESNSELCEQLYTYIKAKEMLAGLNVKKRQNGMEISTLQLSKSEITAKLSKIDEITDEKKAKKLLQSEEQMRNSLISIDKELLKAQQRKEGLETKIKRCHEIIDKRGAFLIEKYNKIKEYQNCLARVSQINAKIDENLDKIKNEGKIKENMQKIKEEIAMVEQENSELLLLESDNIDIENDSDYSTYRYNASLLNVANKMLEDKSKNQKTDYQQTREVIKIARNVLEEKVQELKNKSSVKYFSNLNKIKSLTKSVTRYEGQLEKIEIAKNENLYYAQQILACCNNKTIEQVEQELEQLTNEKELLDNIMLLSDKKQELSRLEKIIHHDARLIEKIKKYKTLSSTQYSQAISRLDLKY